MNENKIRGFVGIYAMIDTILLDLDGTLLKYTQAAFLSVYFAELPKVFTRMGMDTELTVKALWAGTKAMVLNDGGRLNAQRFWETFAHSLALSEEDIRLIEAACDSFYENEFNLVKTVMEPSEIPKRLVHALIARGYHVVLATNPLFPACAVTTRLGWIGLEPRDFQLITHYANSTYCKPNPGYYREIFTKTGKAPEQCLMAGNNPAEDMVAGTLGCETFLVTDCLENEAGMDITAFRRGTLAELETYLISLPDTKK